MRNNLDCNRRYLVSDIFVDTVSPTIKLVGSADYYVIWIS